MKSFLLNISIATSLLSVGLQSFADTAYFDIKKVTTKELASEALPGQPIGTWGISTDCTENTTVLSETSLDPIDVISVEIDKIINIGKKIWDLVVAGKPVMNIKTDVATALPSGVRCWLDLQGWKMPESKVYETAFENAYGVTVVGFKYRVVFVPGGSYNGKGQYIAYATVQPVDVSVAWGFKFNAEATVPTVFNMGTKDSPIGGMQMVMKYTVDSPLRVIQQSQAYGLNGQGEFKVLD